MDQNPGDGIRVGQERFERERRLTGGADEGNRADLYRIKWSNRIQESGQAYRNSGWSGIWHRARRRDDVSSTVLNRKPQPLPNGTAAPLLHVSDMNPEREKVEDMKTIEFENRAQWRAWLAEHHDSESEIWLVFYKKETGIPSIEYGESLDEALCYGWVDSIIKSIDERKYARKFTPRKDESRWSLVNKKRAEQLIRDGLMTDHGMRKVEAAKRSGSWYAPGQKPKMDFEMPKEFSEALRDNPKAKAFFDGLAASHQKQYLGWIITAKRPETGERRIAESIRMLTEGKKLGLR